MHPFGDNDIMYGASYIGSTAGSAQRDCGSRLRKGRT